MMAFAAAFARAWLLKKANPFLTPGVLVATLMRSAIFLISSRE